MSGNRCPPQQSNERAPAIPATSGLPAAGMMLRASPPSSPDEQLVSPLPPFLRRPSALGKCVFPGSHRDSRLRQKRAMSIYADWKAVLASLARSGRICLVTMLGLQSFLLPERSEQQHRRRRQRGSRLGTMHSPSSPACALLQSGGASRRMYGAQSYGLDTRPNGRHERARAHTHAAHLYERRASSLPTGKELLYTFLTPCSRRCVRRACNPTW